MSTIPAHRHLAGGPPGIIDLTRVAARLDDTRAVLDAVAADLRDLWSDVVVNGDFATLNRVVEASHAIHRAAVALSGDTVVPGHAGDTA